MPRPIISIRDLAAAARGRRADLGLSQAEVARRARVSRQWVSEFESGKPAAELRLVLALFDALDLTLSVDDGTTPTSAPLAPAVDLDALLDGYRKR